MVKTVSPEQKEYRQRVLDAAVDFTPEFSGLKEIKSSGQEGWQTALCPFHNDKKSSFGFNVVTGAWCCFGGCGKGDVFGFRAILHSEDFWDVLVRIGDRYGVPRVKNVKNEKPPIDEKIVSKCAQALWSQSDVVTWLKDKRGLTEETLKKYQIGWDPKKQRNTIPIRDERGNAVNIRLYNQKNKVKIINYTNKKYRYGSPARLYGLDELTKYQGSQVIICEGEWDRLITQQEGFMTVTGTGGAGVFSPEWAPHFKGKDVVLILDCDDPGQKAAIGALNVLRHAETKSLKNVVLPLKGDKNDKDLTDYFHKRGQSGTDLQRIIDETPVFKFPEKKKEEVLDVESFIEVESPSLIDKKIRVPLTVCGETSEAFHAVEEFKTIYCPKMAKGGCNECKGTLEPAQIPHGEREYIGSCMTNDFLLTNMLRKYACKFDQKPNIEITKRTTVKEFFCHQTVKRVVEKKDEETGEVVQELDGKRQELVEKRVYYLSHSHPKPGNYEAVGWVKSHPKTQQITFLIESMEPLEDDFESFDLQASIPLLKEFQKLSIGEIIEDLNNHVTRIHERDDILIAVLLTFLSPRWMVFNNERIRGWIICGIVGDSGSGKTQTYRKISEFIGVGDTFSCLTGSRTGLAYALVEHKQKGWQVKVGRYPANTRKIMMADEVQTLEATNLDAIANAMDEGFMQIDRVQSQGYETETRLILIANPKWDRTMDEFGNGCETLLTLFKKMFIRRMDLAVFANSGDIEKLPIDSNQVSGGKIRPEMLRALVYWVWNLKESQVSFEEGLTQYILDISDDMSERFGWAIDIPLVPPSDFRKKLARISTAFAALAASANEDFTRLIVRQVHIETAWTFLKSIYGHRNCGLDQHSILEKANTQLKDYPVVKKIISEKMENNKHGPEGGESIMEEILFAIYTHRFIKREDLVEQVGCSKETVSRYISLLKKLRMVDSTKNGYSKKPRFNKFIHQFRLEFPNFLKV